MYPEEATLSAYLDGELSADERREVDALLSDDDGVRERLEQLRAVKEALSIASPEVQDDDDWVPRSHARVWNRLEAQTLASSRGSGFGRNVRIPLAAVVAFAACFVMLGAALLVTVVQDRRQASSLEALSAARDAPITINVDSQDTDRLLEWLSSNEMLGQVNVKLPSHPQFEIIGEPVLMPASEYRPTTSRGSRAP